MKQFIETALKQPDLDTFPFQLLALSIVYESFVRNLFTWETQTDILALKLFEDGAILALKANQQ